MKDILPIEWSNKSKYETKICLIDKWNGILQSKEQKWVIIGYVQREYKSGKPIC